MFRTFQPVEYTTEAGGSNMQEFAGNALTTADVCRELNVTPREVHRLVAEGYLDVVAISRFKHGVMPLFSEDQVVRVRKKIPSILRGWDREKGARWGKDAARERLRNWCALHRTRARKERFLQALADLPEKSGRLLRAAYYLYHLNHYAKAGESYLYDLKEQVLKAMSASFTAADGLEIYFIPGRDRIRLCPDCRRRARKEKRTYLEFAEMTGGCAHCQRDEGYFSLYEFQIAYDDHHFCFHSPAQVAGKWLKGKNLPTRESSEREGGYPFGRPISAGEAVAVNLAEVIAELESFLASQGLAAKLISDPPISRTGQPAVSRR
jgi:hypothetical protein